MSEVLRDPGAVRRVTFAAGLGVTIALGLASRHFGDLLPAFVAAYAGDFLWATAAYLALGMVSPCTPISSRATATFVVAVLIEASQLYHAPWIDGIRATLFGRLFLGSGFLWSDIACYAGGVLVASGIESGCRALARK